MKLEVFEVEVAELAKELGYNRTVVREIALGIWRRNNPHAQISKEGQETILRKVADGMPFDRIWEWQYDELAVQAALPTLVEVHKRAMEAAAAVVSEAKYILSNMEEDKVVQEVEVQDDNT